MRLKIFTLIVISLFCGCVDVDLPIVRGCGIYNTQEFCGNYDFMKMRFVGPIGDVKKGTLDGGFCIPKEDFLLKLKPKIKELMRQVKDSKKKDGKIYFDGHLRFREDFSVR